TRRPAASVRCVWTRWTTPRVSRTDDRIRLPPGAAVGGGTTRGAGGVTIASNRGGLTLSRQVAFHGRIIASRPGPGNRVSAALRTGRAAGHGDRPGGVATADHGVVERLEPTDERLQAQLKRAVVHPGAVLAQPVRV